MDGTPYVCMYASKGPRAKSNADVLDGSKAKAWAGKRAHSIPKVAQLVARACTTTIRNDASISKRQWENALDCWRAQMRLVAPPRSDAAPVSTPPGLRPTVRVADGGQRGAFA